MGSWHILRTTVRCNQLQLRFYIYFSNRSHAVYEEEFAKFRKDSNERHKQLGRNGKCEFSRLPYYRCGSHLLCAAEASRAAVLHGERIGSLRFQCESVQSSQTA